MKVFFSLLVGALIVFSFVGCEEKSEMDKAKDSISKAFSDTKDAVKDATK